jgi:hypothetical protein
MHTSAALPVVAVAVVAVVAAPAPLLAVDAALIDAKLAVTALLNSETATAEATVHLLDEGHLQRHHLPHHHDHHPLYLLQCHCHVEATAA